MRGDKEYDICLKKTNVLSFNILALQQYDVNKLYSRINSVITFVVQYEFITFYTELVHTIEVPSKQTPLKSSLV